MTPRWDPRKQSLVDLGRTLTELLTENQPMGEEDLYRLGQTLDRALRAGLKGALEGSQSHEQIRPDHLKAAHNFTRQLRREVDRRRDPPPEGTPTEGGQP